MKASARLRSERTAHLEDAGKSLNPAVDIGQIEARSWLRMVERESNSRSSMWRNFAFSDPRALRVYPASGQGCVIQALGFGLLEEDTCRCSPRSIGELKRSQLFTAKTLQLVKIWGNIPKTSLVCRRPCRVQHTPQPGEAPARWCARQLRHLGLLPWIGS